MRPPFLTGRAVPRGGRSLAAASAWRRLQGRGSGSSASPAHSRGSSSTRTKAVSSRRRGRGENGILRPLEPGVARTHRSLAPLRVDRQLAVEQPPDSRPWMDVAVCDTAGREVDPVAADDPADPGVELHLRGERSARGVTAELPDEGVAADASLPEPMPRFARGRRRRAAQAGFRLRPDARGA